MALQSIVYSTASTYKISPRKIVISNFKLQLLRTAPTANLLTQSENILHYANRNSYLGNVFNQSNKLTYFGITSKVCKIKPSTFSVITSTAKLRIPKLVTPTFQPPVIVSRLPVLFYCKPAQHLFSYPKRSRRCDGHWAV